jgi:hypothetical protein
MTHLDDEPTPKADTAHRLGTIRKSRGKGTWGMLRPKRVSRRERSKKGREEKRADKHSQPGKGRKVELKRRGKRERDRERGKQERACYKRI